MRPLPSIFFLLAIAAQSGLGVAQTKAATSLTMTVGSPSHNPAYSGQFVQFLATVQYTGTSPKPTGTVDFFADGNLIDTGTLGNGVGSNQALGSTRLPVGSYTITATYNGDANFNGSTGALDSNPMVWQKGTTKILPLDFQPATNASFGGSVTISATVAVIIGSGFASGTILFLDGPTQIGSGVIGATYANTASFTTSSLSVGTHQITATWDGDANFNGSTASASYTIGPGNTQMTLNSSQNPSNAGQPVTFTATVTAYNGSGGTPAGTVTFLDGGTPRGRGHSVEEWRHSAHHLCRWAVIASPLITTTLTEITPTVRACSPAIRKLSAPVSRRLRPTQRSGGHRRFQR